MVLLLPKNSETGCLFWLNFLKQVVTELMQKKEESTPRLLYFLPGSSKSIASRLPLKTIIILIIKCMQLKLKNNVGT